VDPISPELIEQCLGVLQDRRVEAFGEPDEDRSEKLASLLPLTLVAPEPRHGATTEATRVVTTLSP
jgi:hypothetical protein